MDPATIAALVTGVTSVVGLIAAGIVACCRSQKNEADQRVNDSSTDAVIASAGGLEKTTTTYDDQNRITSVIVEKHLPTTVTIKADDIGGHKSGASNVINGYDHNSLEAAVSKQAGAGSATAAASAASAAGADSAVASRAESKPPVIDTKSVIQPVPGQRSTLEVNKLEVTNGDLSIVIEGFSSKDIRSAPSLEPHPDVGDHHVETTGSVNHHASEA